MNNFQSDVINATDSSSMLITDIILLTHWFSSSFAKKKG